MKKLLKIILRSFFVLGERCSVQSFFVPHHEVNDAESKYQKGPYVNKGNEECQQIIPAVSQRLNELGSKPKIDACHFIIRNADRAE